jgi:hypothetical protein
VTAIATLKRGMTEWRPEAVKLKMSTYLVSANLPPIPATFGHVHSPAPAGGWGMLGNSECGDCVLAGAAHETMVFAWATGKPIPTFTPVNVREQYRELTGGPDTGLDPIATAKWRVSTGLTDANGGVHTIKAFGAISGQKELEQAVYLFGACGIGLALPDTAEQQFLHREPWNDLTSEPNPKNGHYVPVVGKNSKGQLMVVTWGRLHAMVPAYFFRYAVGGLCYMSLEYLTDTGKSPELFDEAQLDADLAALG